MAILDAASIRAKKGLADRPQPVDRGKEGSKLHTISDANGTPLCTGVSAANTHDSVMLQPMVERITRVRSRRGPRRGKPAELHAVGDGERRLVVPWRA
ncbi:transposase [Nocardia rhamnosiphila]|uniref:transposase n=1 Tax=Nocardia rhamnosiphila TaxID=426716 RepID=UPI003F4CF12B